MSRSKFFRERRPRTAAKQQVGDVADLFGGASSSASGSLLTLSSKARKGDEVDAYTLYNYLAVTRIAMRASHQFPMAGIVVDAETPGRSQGKRSNTVRFPKRLGVREKQWLQTYYGGRIIQSAHMQDVEVLEDSHPLIRLFHSVNSEDWWESFLFELILFLELTGEAFVWMVPSRLRTRDGLKLIPSQLWVIPTQWVEFKFKRGGGLDFYRVTPYGDPKRRRDIPPEEVIPIKFKNPRDKLRGYSPSTAGGPWIDANEYMEESRIRTFGNSITPSVWLKITKDAGIDPNNEAVIGRIKERWMQRASGIHHHREPQVLPPGIEVDANGNLTPKEMDFKNSTPQVRDNILALRGVNKFIAGFTEGMNRAQVEVAMAHFAEIVINPVLRIVAGAFQEKLAPLYDPRIRIWFPDASPEDRERMLEEAKFLWSVGRLTPNDAARIFSQFGLEPIDDPDYDTGYVPAGLVPLGQNPSMSLPDENDEESSRAAGLEIYGQGEHQIKGQGEHQIKNRLKGNGAVK